MGPRSIRPAYLWNGEPLSSVMDSGVICRQQEGLQCATRWALHVFHHGSPIQRDFGSVCTRLHVVCHQIHTSTRVWDVVLLGVEAKKLRCVAMVLEVLLHFGPWGTASRPQEHMLVQSNPVWLQQLETQNKDKMNDHSDLQTFSKITIGG